MASSDLVDSTAPTQYSIRSSVYCLVLVPLVSSWCICHAFATSCVDALASVRSTIQLSSNRERGSDCGLPPSGPHPEELECGSARYPWVHRVRSRVRECARVDYLIVLAE